jgi:RND family efflux transporter MFP subunit
MTMPQRFNGATPRDLALRGTLAALALAALAASGCGSRGAATEAKAASAPRPVPITVATVETRPVVRTIEMVGTLKGWEEVTIGTKRAGRVVKVLHDMADRVEPGEPLVELDPTDAQLARQLAEAQYLGELVKLGITSEQADAFIEKFGTGEKLLRGEAAQNVILSVPAVVQQRAARDKALADLNRQRQLSQRGVVSSQEFQDIENAYRSAQAAYDNAIVTARSVIAAALAARASLQQAEEALRDTTIRAPLPSALPEGTTRPITYALTKRSVAEGQMLAAGEAVADLVVLDPLRLWGSVPERYSGQVQSGQEVRVRVAAFDRDFPGHVTRINPAVDPVSRTFQVEVAVPNGQGQLRPGGFAKASIITRRDDQALVVPRGAIGKFAGVTKVFVVPGDNDKIQVRSVPVTTGEEGDTWVEVRGDLQPGQRIAESGLAQLADGTTVFVREEAAAKAENVEPSPARESR